MTLSSLQQARAIARPSREQMLNREFSVQQFWNQNRDRFERAWSEWQTENEAKLPQIRQPKVRSRTCGKKSSPESIARNSLMSNALRPCVNTLTALQMRTSHCAPLTGSC